MPAWMKIALLTAAVLLPATMARAASTENPIDFFQRMLEPTIQELKGAPAQRAAKPKTVTAAEQPSFVKPADTPLLAVPLPHLRPEDDAASVLAAPETMGFLPDASREIVVVPTEDMPMPTPRLRPTLGMFEKPRLASVAPSAPLPKLTDPPPAAKSMCGVSLAMLGVEARPLEAMHEGACGIAAPVEIASLDDGAIDITGKAVVNCQIAERLAEFIETTADPLAVKTLGGSITNIRVAGAYACRGRNNIKGAQLSEHAKGNAIDIAAIEVEGHGWVTVGKTETKAELAFLEGIRKAACGPFTTILGPGSDGYHEDHLHFDLAQRNKRGKSRGLYCR
jgi:hypothetical protein